MNIQNALELEKEVKGFVLVAKVKWIGEKKHITGTKNGNDYDFYTLDLLIEDDSGSVYCQVSNPDFGKEKKGETISLISCSINEYTNKTGELKRTLRAKEYSFEIIPKDSAHPELPPTRKIEDKDPAEIERDNAIKKVEPTIQPNVWAEKDLKIIRQNSNQHATALTIKYFKGSLEEAIAEVIKTSNILVASVYQGLEFPIKDIQEDKPEKTQEERVAEMAANTAKNVAALPINKEKTK